jgi:putative transferase (TIGR04331 family)
MKKKFYLCPLYNETNFEFHKNLFFLGRWCVPFKKEDINTIENCLPYHWKKKQKKIKDFNYLKKLYISILKSLSIKLNNLHNVNFSIKEWKIIIGPWLMAFLVKSFDSFENIKTALKKKNKFNIYFYQIDKKKIVSNNYIDYAFNKSNDFNYNQLIYQEIINSSFKNNFIIKSKKFRNKKINLNLEKKNNFFFDSIKKKVFSTKKFNVFFDFNYINKLYKFGLIFFLKIFPNYAFEAYNYKVKKINHKIRNKSFNLISKNKFERFINYNLLKFLPMSYLESFGGILNDAKKINFRAKNIFSSGSYISNDFFKIWLSLRVKENAKFYILYHGGGVPFKEHNFGHDEKIANKVLVWHKPIKKKQEQLPNLILRNTTLSRLKRDILVTLDPNISYYPVRTDDGPFSSLFLDDLNQKIKFSKLIIDDSQRIVMRPYNNQIWDYKNRITKHLGKEIIDTNIKFLDSLKKTKLHISGYLSTTFSQSISYNIPTLGLIVEDLYSFSSKFNYILKILKKNKILFDDPKKLHLFLKRNNYEIDNWWNSKKIQRIIEIYKKDVLGENKDKLNGWINFLIKNKIR